MKRCWIHNLKCSIFTIEIDQISQIKLRLLFNQLPFGRHWNVISMIFFIIFRTSNLIKRFVSRSNLRAPLKRVIMGKRRFSPQVVRISCHTYGFRVFFRLVLTYVTIMICIKCKHQRFSFIYNLMNNLAYGYDDRALLIRWAPMIDRWCGWPSNVANRCWWLEFGCDGDVTAGLRLSTTVRARFPTKILLDDVWWKQTKPIQ